jgi:hypothetical protein
MSTTILEQIEHLKFHELYDGPINAKLKTILENPDSKNNMEEIIDAILHTRDIRQGRGLSHLTYSYLFTLQQVFPAKAVFAIYMIVTQKIGSWRDVRCYCEFVAEHSEKGRADPIIKPIIGLYNHQLVKDVAAWKNALASETVSRPDARDYISYAVRWIPRPRKGRAWLFHMLVVMWVYKDPEYKAIVNSTDDAERTCKKMYRKMISDLNKELDRA